MVKVPQRYSSITKEIERLYNKYKDNMDGHIPNYYPELGKADPKAFAIALTTTEGKRFTIGDHDTTFTTMSCSKPFVYGLALDQYDSKTVQSRVGVEPTGDAFNSIIELNASNRPHNPMTNAGAIVTADMIRGQTPADRFEAIQNMFAKYIGHKPNIDMTMFMSAKKFGHRNRAIAHLLLGLDELNKNVGEALDLYFQQCSLSITCTDLSLMGATLANKGLNPITGERAIKAEHIRRVLSIMLTCGLYDYSGEWVYDVGLPAKTGVSGGTLVVIPGIGGLAIYSPLIDKFGNSVRGINVCEELSKELKLHIFDRDFDTFS